MLKTDVIYVILGLLGDFRGILLDHDPFFAGSQRSGIAGAFAGAVSVLATMPQDTVKTRMQGHGGVTTSVFRNRAVNLTWCDLLDALKLEFVLMSTKSHTRCVTLHIQTCTYTIHNAFFVVLNGFEMWVFLKSQPQTVTNPPLSSWVSYPGSRRRGEKTLQEHSGLRHANHEEWRIAGRCWALKKWWEGREILGVFFLGYVGDYATQICGDCNKIQLCVVLNIVF